MKWTLAGVLTLVLATLHEPPPAEACGVKLTIKSSTPRKAVARSSNPSEVLLLGAPPRKLERDLSAAGHRVEVASSPSSAKRKSYAIVIADSNLQQEARSSFDGAIVVVRSGDVSADVRSVENQVARRPVRSTDPRAIVAARAPRQPIDAGPAPAQGRQLINSGSKDSVAEPAPTVAKPTPAEPKPTPTVAKPTPAEPKPTPAEPTPTPTVAKPTPAEPTPTVAKVTPAAPKTVAKAKKPGEVFFTLGSTSPKQSAALDGIVRWMTTNPNVHVVIEGHADPTGNADDNMALAQRRAEAVRDHLVSAGIDSSRLEVISYGDTRLGYAATDPRNRRVAIVPKS